VIVRVFSDGQYRIPEEAQARLHELDEQTVTAIDAGDEAAFTATFKELIDLIHRNGQRLGEDELEPSDLMLPPADTTLEEAREEFTGEGLIPEWLSAAAGPRGSGSIGRPPRARAADQAGTRIQTVSASPPQIVSPKERTR
jgi:hypothetical protein